MKYDGVKHILACMIWALGGYVLLQAVIYGTLPFWKWKSGELGLAMLTVSVCCLLIEDVRKFLVQVVVFSMFWMSPVFVGVANKKYPHHGHKTPFYAKICRINAGLRGSTVHGEKDIILQKTAQFSPL